MKIIYLSILALSIAACSTTQTQGFSVERSAHEEKLNSVCTNTEAKSLNVYSATEEKSLYLMIGRTLHTPHQFGFFVVNEGGNFTLDVLVFCDIKIPEFTVWSKTELTDAEMSAIYSLYDNIEISRLPDFEKLLTGADGSSWSLAVVENNKGIESLVVRNPDSKRQTEASHQLFLLGEYLWELAKIESPLY